MNNKNKTSIGLSIVAIIIAIVAFGYNKSPQDNRSADSFDKILVSKKLAICYVAWPPSIIKDPNTGKLSGLLIDAIENISKDAGLSIQYVESSWGGFSADLAATKCDAGAAGFYPLINRSTAVSFTRPFYYSGNNGVVRFGDNRFKNIDDLNRSDVSIAVLEGDYAQIYAEKNIPKAKLVVLSKTAANTAPFLAVSSGQADVGLFTDDTAKDYAKLHPEVKPIFYVPYSTTPISWAVRLEDQKLLNFLDNAINYMESTGELDALAKKYNSTWYTLKRTYELAP